MTDHYETLGVEKKASSKEIKKGYKAAVTKAHPDKGGSNEEFASVKTAYDILIDEEKRKLYDEYGEHAPEDGYDKILDSILQQLFSDKNRDHIDDPYRGIVKFIKQVDLDVDNMKNKIKPLSETVNKLNDSEDREKYFNSLLGLTNVHRTLALKLFELETVRGVCYALKEEIEIMYKVLGKDIPEEQSVTYQTMPQGFTVGGRYA